ncbi:hypothetical protein [Pseudoalteromonas sp. PS5]|uniref:hypothetical protein n=1 Tax=Pseudoalteromonas sp. PS5 TaxID=1437473 RepID=UPI000FFEC73C|nr:hypothetical protein [Pseudoalteromonas sp. PS5]RXF04064.1 hypothetical protein D9603_06725 [Pseudoalteromonas sp. PS5]
MWFQALTAAGGWIFEIFKGKQDIVRQAAHAKAQRVISWEEAMANGAATSWKDEWFTVLLSVPFIMCFIPQLAPYAHQGFIQLEQTPEFYRYMFGLAVGASFGFRGFDKFVRTRNIRN